MAFWNERKAFGRKGVTEPAPAEFSQSEPARTDSSLYGKAMCALTYRGQPSRSALFGPLFADTLRDILVSAPNGDLASGTALLPTRWGLVVLMFVEAPMPLPDLPDALAQTLYWNDWRDSAAQWGSHAVIAAFSQPDTLDQARVGTHGVLQVAAVLASATPAEGVNWMSTALFHPAPRFLELCGHRPLPAEVLVQPCFYQGDTWAPLALGIVTRGLRLFGLPEVDYQPGGVAAHEAYSRVMSIASYMLDNGAVFVDGDTLGTDNATQSRVYYAPDPDGGQRLRVVDEQ